MLKKLQKGVLRLLVKLDSSLVKVKDNNGRYLLTWYPQKNLPC